MKQPLALALLGIMLIAGAFLWKAHAPVADAGGETSAVSGTPTSTAPSPATPSTSSAAAPAPSAPTAPPSTERESLQNMARTLYEYSQPQRRFEDLLRDLQQSGQKPFVAKDRNPYTGEMSIVRTKSPFPGTRYFHAQYFSDENGEKVLQHMSFEFRPGPQAMAMATQAVQQIFPNLGRPGLNREDFKEWKLPSGYTLWIKKMDKEDLDPNNPFNVYTAKDLGTIRVAIEEDPHPHEESGASEGH
jgi:hypothetical protein